MAGEETYKLKLSVQRGSGDDITMQDMEVEVDARMVVLDALHVAQGTIAPDLAIRWNCKAGKCGSCGAEVNGKPKLMCMSKLSDYPKGQTLVIKPMHTFPLIRDLVTDVSWNYEINKKIKPFAYDVAKDQKYHDTPRVDGDREIASFRMQQQDVGRSQEFRKCIECFLCQDVCHVLRSHQQFSDFAGPRFFVRLASLEMHPLDVVDRIPEIKNDFGSGICNITKCCSEICPESIPITDEAIIPLKERVVDRYYDPIKIVFRKLKIIK